MNKSNILISDTSSIRFDFLFVHKKPVITLDINRDEMKGYERESILKKIGLTDLIMILDQLLQKNIFINWNLK